MYLFSRNRRLVPGNTRAAMAWATGITEKVNQSTGLNITLFSRVFSPEIGTLSWSTFVPDLAALETAQDKLVVDDAFASMLDEGAKFALGTDDVLMQVLAGEVDPSRQVEYATVVQTTCSNGSVAKGMEVGIEIAKRAEKILGTPVIFGAGVTGSYGSVAWLSGYSDVGSMERALQALNSDTKFVEFVDKNVPGTYTDAPTESSQVIWRRVG